MSVESPTYAAPKPKSKKTIWIVLGVLGLSACCCCGVCVGGPFIMMWSAFRASGDQIAQEFKDDPVIVEHLGGIDSCTFNFSATIKEAQGGNAKGVAVFDVTGPKGSGVLLLEPDQSGNNTQPFSGGKLRMGDQEWDLSMGNSATGNAEGKTEPK